MSKIRILYVVGQLSVGGTELQLLELVRNLNKEIFEIKVVCLSGSEAVLSDRFADIGCHPTLLYRERIGRIFTVLRLLGVVKKFDPDIVHAFAYASRAVVPAMWFRPDTKLIVSIRTNPDWQIGFWDKLLNKAVDLILANSKDAQYSIRNIWPDKRCKVIYNGMDFRHFIELAHMEPSNVPANADLSRSCKKIVLVARLEQVKNVVMAVNAFHLLVTKRRNVQFWVVGSGSQLEMLKELCSDLGLQKNVVFWGEHDQDNIPTILRYCSAGVLSSKVEGFSNSIMEYMAASLPVVATSVGGNSELIVDGETGFLVPISDVEKMADRISVLLSADEIAMQMGRAGCLRIKEKFTIEKMVAETTMQYKELLN